MTHADAGNFYEREYAGSIYAAPTQPTKHAYYAMVSRFVEEYDLSRKRCIEIGCGRGAFQDLVQDYVDVDYAWAAGRYLHKPFFQCDAAYLPFADDTFDAAWSVDVLEHVAQPEKALDEMRRVVRPGAFCSWSLPGIRDPGLPRDTLCGPTMTWARGKKSSRRRLSSAIQKSSVVP